MKSKKFLGYNSRLSILLFALATIIASPIFVSCSDDNDDDGLKARPEIILELEQVSNKTGSMVEVKMTANAPAGLQNINILRSGLNFHTQNFADNPKSTEWIFQYKIEEPIGSTVNFSISASDVEGRSSEVAILSLTVTSKPVKNIAAGNLLGEHTWYADTIYRLNGFVRVGKDQPQADGTFVQETAVLTIEPGTLIVGEKTSKGTLIVQRGSKIFAEGTVDNPIIMTSEAPVGQRLPGDWGGLVVCGRVKNNQGENVELEGGYGAYHGGTVEIEDTSESSGVIKYVRIEFAGIPINPNEEVNSLTMGSVGKGTIIEYVQCSYGLDDAFEWFGGSVDAKYLVAYRCLDDDLDVDFGFSGHVQFALVIRDASLADQSGSNGFEVDNNGQGTDAEPFTSGRFANITIIGPKKTSETAINTDYQHGAQLRRNSMLRIYNSFITGFPTGIYVDDARGMSSQHAINDDLRLRNVILAGVENWGGNGFGLTYDPEIEGFVEGLPYGENNNHPNAPRGFSLKQDDQNPEFNIVDWFNKVEYGNQRLASWKVAGINPSIFDLTEKPGVLPLDGSMLLDAARWDNVPERNQFEQVPFSGAFGIEDWTEGWTEWLPVIAPYM